MGVFGYPRYYNRREQLLTLIGGGITVDFNGVAGGALWHWSWNGMQFINNWDNGRQIQTDIFPPDYAIPKPAIPGAAIRLPLWNLRFTTAATRSRRKRPDGTQQCQYQAPAGASP